MVTMTLSQDDPYLKAGATFLFSEKLVTFSIPELSEFLWKHFLLLLSQGIRKLNYEGELGILYTYRTHRISLRRLSSR